MMKGVGLQKSEDFGVKILKLYDHLKERKAPNPIIEQIIKSGTSIGANLNEANCAISEKDFLAKVYISLKECNETRYWLKLLRRTDFITKSLFESLDSDCEEIYKILSATTFTVRKRINNNASSNF